MTVVTMSGAERDGGVGRRTPARRRHLHLVPPSPPREVQPDPLLPSIWRGIVAVLQWFVVGVVYNVVFSIVVMAAVMIPFALLALVLLAFQAIT
jgi:hypothetical protein